MSATVYTRHCFFFVSPIVIRSNSGLLHVDVEEIEHCLCWLCELAFMIYLALACIHANDE